MQADGRLVQDVQHAHKARANLRRQADALHLATGKRRGGAAEREVVQTDVHHEPQARDDLLDDGGSDEVLALRQLQALEE